MLFIATVHIIQYRTISSEHLSFESRTIQNNGESNCRTSWPDARNIKKNYTVAGYGNFLGSPWYPLMQLSLFSVSAWALLQRRNPHLAGLFDATRFLRNSTTLLTFPLLVLLHLSTAVAQHHCPQSVRLGDPIASLQHRPPP